MAGHASTAQGPATRPFPSTLGVMLPRMLRRNYHTHTFRCQHASGDCLDYARVAEAVGMEVLGFSDHTPLPDDRWPEVRMAMAELDDYEVAIQRAQVEIPDLLILQGMECEYLPEYHAFYAEELLGRRDYDYLIGAVHFIDRPDGWVGAFGAAQAPKGLRRYVDLTIATIDAGLFVCIAHPDVFGSCNPDWNADTAQASRDICQAAVAGGIALELNAYGLRKAPVQAADGTRPGYPWLPFWEIAGEEGVSVVLSSDAHRPEDVAHGGEELGMIRDRYGLKEVDVLELIAQR